MPEPGRAKKAGRGSDRAGGGRPPGKIQGRSVLLRQAYIRDEDITIEKLLMQNVAAIVENVIIRRFARWELAKAPPTSRIFRANRQVGPFYNRGFLIWKTFEI